MGFPRKVEAVFRMGGDQDAPKKRRALSPQSLAVMVSPKRARSRFWKAGMVRCARDAAGRVAAVEVAAQRDSVLAIALQPAVDVAGDVIERGLAALAEKAAAEVEAHQAAALANAIELRIGKVARRSADGSGCWSGLRPAGRPWKMRPRRSSGR